MKYRVPGGQSLIMYGTDLAKARLKIQWTAVQMPMESVRTSRGKISLQ